MSMPVTTITCTHCDFSSSDVCVWGNFNYVQAGKEVPLNRELGWCHACRTFAPVEVLPSPARVQSIRRQIAEREISISRYRQERAQQQNWLRNIFRLQGETPPHLSKIESELLTLERQLSKELQELEFLQGRVSPPRCLSCGAVEIARIPQDVREEMYVSEWVEELPIGMTHPACGGSFKVTRGDFRLSVDLESRLFDLEGRAVSSA